MLDRAPKGHLLIEFGAARCEHCQCSRIFSPARSEIQLLLARDSTEKQGLTAVRPGQQVALSVGKRHFSLVAAVLFGLPLLGGFVAASLATFASLGAGAQIAMVLCGVLTGALLARTCGAQLQAMLQKSLAVRAADC